MGLCVANKTAQIMPLSYSSLWDAKIYLLYKDFFMNFMQWGSNEEIVFYTRLVTCSNGTAENISKNLSSPLRTSKIYRCDLFLWKEEEIQTSRRCRLVL